MSSAINENVGPAIEGHFPILFELIQPGVGTVRTRQTAVLVIEAIDPTVGSLASLIQLHSTLLKTYISPAAASSTPLRHRVACLGIFQNALSRKEWPGVLSSSLPLIRSVLSIDTLAIGKMMNGLSPNILQEVDVPVPLVSHLDEWQSAMGALITLLEILSNFVTTEDNVDSSFTALSDGDSHASAERAFVNSAMIDLFLSNNLLMAILNLSSMPASVSQLTEIKVQVTRFFSFDNGSSSSVT